MIAEFQVEAPLLRAAVREPAVGSVVVEELDTSGTVPLRAVCWFEGNRPGPFEDALAADKTVSRVTRVAETSRGHQYNVTSDRQYPEVEMYATAVEENGIFVSGIRSVDGWTVRMRFPDRDAFAAFRDRIGHTGLSLQSIRRYDTEPRADRYGVSGPQREILLLAAERGYFDVPRRASLADLADDLGVSSQAASERLRRGLDSLVERALLPPQ